MLVFIDESGDPGLKIEKGSSRFFTIAMVIFDDNEEATACDQRIRLLKKELGWAPEREFHFKKNSHHIRSMFLQAVARYNFFYYGIIINKSPEKLWGESFKDKNSFYKYACGLVLQNAKMELKDSTLVIDKSGNLDFRRQLSKYLRRFDEREEKLVRKIKMQRSETNNLIQLADYIAGILNRSHQGRKKNADFYRKIISHREVRVQIWPK